ncbi:hypothetical protein [Mitsuaria sp. WAJ17]|nr:hypothetical protein [Mitsuaria sp. WAJ17]
MTRKKLLSAAVNIPNFTGATMGNKIVTEADKRAAPRPVPANGVSFTHGRGNCTSLERGTHTRSKKNPGKRTHKGG